ncbi:uncharacterized protein CDV56_101108 [Aspergillus thermomutatus]|uniref:Uncharacterized protein n=1 Tax=Aspergillus thermomutatus TaxID=41047 RepID=A0A397HL94_ASPTH|nr:uncharacterized protein CDV56_101108 [Aspergillus thermomutatus]RHZ62124.1 hypothetical protein CDV56_101108 [Aspergillus thermomutatus]
MGNPALGTGTTAGGVNWVGYLTSAGNASLVLSYNLAVGGATIDGSLVGTTANDVVRQVSTFDAAYSSKPASAPWTSEDAVFTFWIGVNDIAVYNQQLATMAESFQSSSTGVTAILVVIHNQGPRQSYRLRGSPMPLASMRTVLRVSGGMTTILGRSIINFRLWI